MRITPLAGGPIASGCPLAVGRTAHDYPFGFFLQDRDALSASKAVQCARKETSIFPHQIEHPLQALRSERLLPQESLKISMRCSPFAEPLDWLGGRSAVS